MRNWIVPDWPAPNNIHAAMSTRRGGVSQPPFDSLNLGDHVGDDPQAVADNRQALVQTLALPNMPRWLQQVHGCSVAESPAATCEADAMLSRQPGEVCAVLTADCLPLLVCNHSGRQVAAIHAGWRGLAAGIIEQTLRRFPADDPLLIWLGPAIGSSVFEVGDEVRAAFVQRSPGDVAAFRPGPAGRWLANLYQLARHRCEPFNVAFMGGGQACTYSESERFFSYRRDGQTGRMASLIWLNSA